MRRGDRIPRKECEAWDCTRPQHAKHLCLKHYKREARGLDVRTAPDKAVGDPSGYGQYGVLDDDGDRVLCHECGDRLRAVGSHLAKAHAMTAAEYRTRHGLGKTLPLSTRSLGDERSEIARARIGDSGWLRFEAARDPIAASHSRDMDEIRTAARPSVSAQRAETSAAKGRATRRGAEYECVVCRARWCQVSGARQPQTCGLDCLRELQSRVVSAHHQEASRTAGPAPGNAV